MSLREILLEYKYGKEPKYARDSRGLADTNTTLAQIIDHLKAEVEKLRKTEEPICYCGCSTKAEGFVKALDGMTAILEKEKG